MSIINVFSWIWRSKTDPKPNAVVVGRKVNEIMVLHLLKSYYGILWKL